MIFSHQQVKLYRGTEISEAVTIGALNLIFAVWIFGALNMFSLRFYYLEYFFEIFAN